MFEWFAGLDPQVQSGWIAGLTASLSTGLTVWLTQRYASKNLKETLEAEKAKHEAQLTEQRADRLFEARREVASKCLGSIQNYKMKANDKDHMEALQQLNNTLTENGGDLAALFSRELNEVVSNIQWTIFFIFHATYQEEEDFKTIRKLSADGEPSENDREEIDRLNYVIEKRMESTAKNMENLKDEFDMLTYIVGIELGAHEEPPAFEEA